MKEIQAPSKYVLGKDDFSIFLAGSIEMGAAEQWQRKVTEALAGYSVTVLNPRRDDWDSSWVQSIDDANFREQVEWELKALEEVRIILMCLSPGTKSPVSLLELGLFHGPHMFVCCPDGFWRKGNVEVTMAYFSEPHMLYNDLDDMIESVKGYLEEWGRG